MRFRKMLSSILTVVITLTSIPLASFAEGEIKEKSSAVDRWSYRNTWSQVVENPDGTYPNGTIADDDLKQPVLFQNLFDLSTLPANPSNIYYPREDGMRIYQTPMFVDLPPDISATVGPEDLEVYTVFSEPGENIKGKLSEEEFKKSYERKDTFKNKETAEEYKMGIPNDQIYNPELGRYSAKKISISKPILYDKNHQVVPQGQKGGAYFVFTVRGPRETINPGPDLDNQNASPQGYGLRVDGHKIAELKERLKAYMNAGIFYKQNQATHDYKSPPTEVFDISDINDMIRTAKVEKPSGDSYETTINEGMFNTIIKNAAAGLSRQFVAIDPLACIQNGATEEQAKAYKDLAGVRSAWASGPDGYTAIFEDILMTDNTTAQNLLNKALYDQVVLVLGDIMIQDDEEKAVHQLMKLISGGSFIKFKKDANGNLVTDANGKTVAERDENGKFVYVDNFEEAFSNIGKQGGISTSIYYLFKEDLEKVYSTLPSMTNEQRHQALIKEYRRLLSPGKNGTYVLTDMISGMKYVSPLSADILKKNMPKVYQTFYPIAIRLKTGDSRLNIKATNISIKHIEEVYHYTGYKNKTRVTDGYYYTIAISSTLDMGAYSGPISNIIRAKNHYKGEAIETIDAGTHDFSVNKDFYKEVTTPLMSSSGMTFEYEVNPVKSDGKHNPVEKTYTDNVIRVGDVNLTASGLDVYPTAGGEQLKIRWEATKVGNFNGITDGEVVVKNINLK